MHPLKKAISNLNGNSFLTHSIRNSSLANAVNALKEIKPEQIKSIYGARFAKRVEYYIPQKRRIEIYKGIIEKIQKGAKYICNYLEHHSCNITYSFPEFFENMPNSAFVGMCWFFDTEEKSANQQRVEYLEFLISLLEKDEE